MVEGARGAGAISGAAAAAVGAMVLPTAGTTAAEVAALGTWLCDCRYFKRRGLCKHELFALSMCVKQFVIPRDIVDEFVALIREMRVDVGVHNLDIAPRIGDAIAEKEDALHAAQSFK